MAPPDPVDPRPRADVPPYPPRVHTATIPPTAALGMLLAVAAVAWLPLSLWPQTGLPAWPAVSLGSLGWVLSWGRGAAAMRAFGAILGFCAVLGGGLQIAILWGLALLLRSSGI